MLPLFFFFIQLLMFVFCYLNVLVGMFLNCYVHDRSIQLAVVPFFSYLSSSYTKLMLCCVITKIRLEYMWQNDLINELALNWKKIK
ncbi:hypothetical protein ES319_D09G149400v1 [Gossypium barbadense]|uniref:Uncharacterized protein n=1 Tax=Gossypium barbadense TaxID=3634 RepID=A0A5J5Q579_GOSBA|nr:hypothetical protein ES319_D09G149400v1 [Gossypium barbadense]